MLGNLELPIRWSPSRMLGTRGVEALLGLGAVLLLPAEAAQQAHLLLGDHRRRLQKIQVVDVVLLVRHHVVLVYRWRGSPLAGLTRTHLRLSLTTPVPPSRLEQVLHA